MRKKILFVTLLALTLIGGCQKSETTVNEATPTVQATVAPTKAEEVAATPTVEVAPEETPVVTMEPAEVPTVTVEPTATSIPAPTATSTPTPEPTATSTPVPTATPTPEPTATPVPTSTPTPSPEPTATPVPTSTTTPEPTEAPVPEKECTHGDIEGMQCDGYGHFHSVIDIYSGFEYTLNSETAVGLSGEYELYWAENMYFQYSIYSEYLDGLHGNMAYNNRLHDVVVCNNTDDLDDLQYMKKFAITTGTSNGYEYVLSKCGDEKKYYSLTVELDNGDVIQLYACMDYLEDGDYGFIDTMLNFTYETY